MQDLARISGLLEGPEWPMMFAHNLKLFEENKYLLAGRLVGMSLMQDGPTIVDKISWHGTENVF